MTSQLSDTIRCDKQEWSDMTRYLIISDFGSVQLECYPEVQNFKSRVWLYGLWINEEFRRKGHAAELMNVALSILKSEGYDSVSLDWKYKDTPVEILNWYQRLGFIQVEWNYSHSQILLIKRL